MLDCTKLSLLVCLQEMANLLWSYAMLEHYPCDQLLEAMALHMVERIAAYRPQAVSNSLWAFAKVRSTLDQGLHHVATAITSGPAHQYTPHCSWCSCTPGVLLLSLVSVR